LKFHVEMVVRDNFDPMSAVPVQKMIFAHLIKLMESGRVTDHGIFSDERGGFLMVDAQTPEELFDMLSPLGDAMRMRAQPYVSMTTLKSFFENYEKTIAK
jgi:hypothetical protein